MNLQEHLAQQISATTGEPFRIRERHDVGGGCINEAWRITGSGQRWFVKLNRADMLDMFCAEAEGLDELAKAGAIRVPRPLCWGEYDGRAWLVMENLPMRARADPVRFGRQLARMHQCTRDHFGWHRNNTIGSTPQINTPGQDWIRFWKEHRLGFQLDLAEQHCASRQLIEQGHRLLESFSGLFDGYQPGASVLHGDLWSGNQGGMADGSPVIFDPAVYFGDHEADLAMMELFGNPGETFHAAYREVMPVDSGYSVRRTFYNLYHILNHYNLFGGGYAGQAERMIERLLAHVR